MGVRSICFNARAWMASLDAKVRSFLDVIFVFTYGIYLILRVYGMAAQNVELSRLALDILTTGAPVLVPRLAFNLMSNNMLIVALREMMADFSILSLLAAWCSAGFLLAMTWLSNGLHDPTTISNGCCECGSVWTEMALRSPWISTRCLVHS
jgi:hypothetical protein